MSIAIVTGVSVIGVWFMAAPTRAAGALNEWFAIVPIADTRAKRVVFRIVGLGLLVGGTRYGMPGVWGAIRAVFN